MSFALSLQRTLGFVTSHPINRRRASRGLIDFARWQMRSRLSPGSSVQNWISGARFYARRGETGWTGNIYAGLHEFEDMAYVLHVLDGESTFVDVGANAGAYTVLAGCVAGARALAFEPVPETYARLRANIELSRAESHVRAINAAAGREPGSVRFTCTEDTTNHVVADSEAAGADSIHVPVVRLDDVLTAPCSVMKIDVEGFELAVLEGARECLRDPELHSIVIELNGSGARYGISDLQVAQLLFDAGFQSYRYAPFTRTLTPAGQALNNSGNTLFVRDVERARRLVRSAAQRRVKGVLL